MKKSIILILLFVFVGMTSVLASCDLTVQLVNQDPYPAVPGDYVKLLFRVTGVESPDCGEVSFVLLENYPLKFDPGFNPVQILEAGTFSRGYNSNWIVPYNVRVDSAALDGDAEIEVLYTTKGSTSFKTSKMFNLTIEEVRADFNVFIRDYDYSSNKLVFEVLNIAKNDVQSVILTIPPQENIKVFGANKNIVGDLDSNDYTSTDFDATPENGNILVEIEYTDTTGERRLTSLEVPFDSQYFVYTIPSKTTQIRNLVILAVVVILIIVWYIRRKKKKLIR